MTRKDKYPDYYLNSKKVFLLQGLGRKRDELVVRQRPLIQVVRSCTDQNIMEKSIKLVSQGRLDYYSAVYFSINAGSIFSVNDQYHVLGVYDQNLYYFLDSHLPNLVNMRNKYLYMQIWIRNLEEDKQVFYMRRKIQLSNIYSSATLGFRLRIANLFDKYQKRENDYIQFSKDTIYRINIKSSIYEL